MRMRKRGAPNYRALSRWPGCSPANHVFAPVMTNNGLANDSTGVRSDGDAIRCATKRKPICSQNSTLSPAFHHVERRRGNDDGCSKQTVLPLVTAAFSLVHAIVCQSAMIKRSCGFAWTLLRPE